MDIWNPQEQIGNQPPTHAVFHPPASAAPPRGRRTLGGWFWVRLVGALVLAVAAVAIYFGMAPAEKVSATERADLALSLNKQNESEADSAPKQTVVNGWIARDLLTIIASESDRSDNRPAALLTLGIVGIAFFGATSAVGRSRP